MTFDELKTAYRLEFLQELADAGAIKQKVVPLIRLTIARQKHNPKLAFKPCYCWAANEKIHLLNRLARVNQAEKDAAWDRLVKKTADIEPSADDPGAR